MIYCSLQVGTRHRNQLQNVTQHFLQTFIEPSITATVSLCIAAAAAVLLYKNDRMIKPVLHSFYFHTWNKKVSFTIIFTEMKTVTTIFRIYISVQTALFQPGGVGCCFTFTWRSAWSFFGGSLCQVIELSGWSWLLEERKKCIVSPKKTILSI